jgi:hypothetical protein
MLISLKIHCNFHVFHIHTTSAKFLGYGCFPVVFNLQLAINCFLIKKIIVLITDLLNQHDSVTLHVVAAPFI